MKSLPSLIFALTAIASWNAANASTLTENSPIGGALPAGVSSVGGFVVDLQGTNGNRVLTQLAANTLFVGSPPASSYPLLVGTQGGFTPAIISALGGGIAAASIRVSLFDGDSQAGNFDFNQNNLTLNGVNFGNFSAVSTNQTTSVGGFISAGVGFGDSTFDTGWFTLTNAASLSSFYSSLSGGSIAFRVNDLSPGDQFYDFSQGVDSSIVNVGSPPVVVMPSIPEPSTYALLLAGLAFVGTGAKRFRRTSGAASTGR